MPELKSHPALTPRRIADLYELARKIDREGAEEMNAEGRTIFAEIKARRRAEQAAEGHPAKEAKGADRRATQDNDRS